MFLLVFLILASIVIIFSVKLTQEAEIIEFHSKLNAALIGILIAISTSLPEFATGITSLFLGYPEMTIGNVLGSNIFNFLILCIFNIMFFRSNLFKRVESVIQYTLFFILLMYFNFFLTSVVFTSSTFSNFELGSIIIIIIYIIAIKVINKLDLPKTDEIISELEKEEISKEKLKKSQINFIIFSIIILISSVFLARSANVIVLKTGISASIVGALFIGIATSLPELITCFSLVKRANYTMAASSVLSSNLFNFLILAILDMLYSKPLYVEMDGKLKQFIYLGIIYSIIYMATINNKRFNKYFNLLISIFMIFLYVVVII